MPTSQSRPLPSESDYTTRRKVLEDWAKAHNAGDLAAMASLYSADAEVIRTRFASWLRGPASLQSALVRLRERFPANYVAPATISVMGEWGAIDWFCRGKGTGGRVFAAPNGEVYDLSGTAFFKIVNGKIVRQFGYLDALLWGEEDGERVFIHETWQAPPL